MVLWGKTAVLLLVIITVVQCHERMDNEANVTSDRSEYKRSLPRDCGSKYSVTCLKLDVVSWVEKLNEEGNYNILPGVAIVKENGTSTTNTAELVSDLAREFPKDPDARLDAFLLRKVSDFINNHSIKLNFFGNDVSDEGEESARKGGGTGLGGLTGTGGGGGKKGGGMGGAIFAAAAMMKGTLLALALGALAAIAGKALMTGLISLMLSAILGLKSLSGGGGKTTYEVVAKPIYSHENTHSSSHEDHHSHGGHGGWGRSYEVPLPLGLRPEYKPA
ncbi:uncharacterized protein LOC108743456 [Agrilus planipennis]|uniref:Uncharacterized protein LOC108743456 n=1 Tax=Agrilus planipennis TaxID=224129 RepID=A0A1W4XET7_AGRPL|nr:uncharacterized protein LOC108743456 [Agrilus planipennis]